MRIYRETFDNGPAGWYGWDATGATRLPIEHGAAVSRGPWWVDYNHAPPGAGYLHILFALNTRIEADSGPVAGPNRFIADVYPRDFTNAEVTLRIRGTVDARGASLVLLVQSDVSEPRLTRINSVLTAQPIEITPDWSEQTITCVPDNGQWTCLGSRHDRFATYGSGPIAPVLRDVTCDIIFVLFPLDVGPAEPVSGDIHIPAAGRDYQVDRSRLPTGVVSLDRVAIAFPG